MKAKVYLDTTILSYLFDRRKEIKNFTEVTRAWWNKERRHYSLYLSLETLAELQLGSYPHKERAIRAAGTIQILPRIQEVAETAETYVEHFLMPKKLEGDAIHLAYASCYKMDFLLTWNCKHLANANKKKHIRILNTKLGLFVPELITPLELFTE